MEAISLRARRCLRNPLGTFGVVSHAEKSGAWGLVVDVSGSAVLRDPALTELTTYGLT